MGTSAIESLLQNLAGPQLTTQAPPPMAGPQVAPLPPQPQVQPPGMIHRIVGLLSSLGNQVGNPSAPQGYEGLLTPDEIQQAKPGRLASIFEALGTYSPGGTAPAAQYRANLDHLVGMRQLAMQIGEHQRQLQAERAMADLFPPPTPSGDPETDRRNLQTNLAQQYSYAVSHNLPDLVKDIGSSLRGIMSAPPRGFEPQLFQSPDGTQVHFFTPAEQTQVPPGWKPVLKPGASGMGTPQLFRAPANAPAGMPKEIGIAPGDNDTLAKYSAMGYKPEVTARTEFVQGNVEGRFDRSRVDSGVKAYTTAIKPLTDRALALDKAINSIQNAASNPDPNQRKILYGSAYSQFVQAADQDKNLRYQLLQYYEHNIDPSIAGRWNILKDRLVSGQLPPYVSAAMLNHLKLLRTMTSNEIESRRNDTLNRRPDLTNELPETSSYFTEPVTDNPQSSVTPGSTTGRTVVVNGKTFKLP